MPPVVKKTGNVQNKIMSEEKEVQDVSETKVEETNEQENEGKFEKDSETVPASKYNQLLRKQREKELEARELEKKLKELEVPKVEKKVIENDEEEDDDFFKEEKQEKVTIDTSKIIEEKLKPVYEQIKKRDDNDRKLQRSAFFEAHPEYLKDSEKFQELLDEMENSINPNSKDDYYTQLEKTHRILRGDTFNPDIENKNKDIANDASGNSGAEKDTATDNFTAEDRQYMKQWNISEKGMLAYKAGLKDGSIRV